MEASCKHCGGTVSDGRDGTVYDAPPWAPAGTPCEAVCYGCENEAELAAEDRRQEDQVEAAIRAGRHDLA